MQSKRRILVTGGMGFVGSVIIERLLSRDTITVADRIDFGVAPSLEPMLRDRMVESVVTELSQTSSLHKRMASGEFDVVIHLAAAHYIPECEKNPVPTYRDNLLSTLLLLTHTPPGCRFLNFSTAAVYKPDERPHSEESSVIGPCDVYGWAKRHAEDLTAYYAKVRGFSAISIRLFNAVGPGETNPHILTTILLQLGEGRSVIELGNLSPKRDFIHVEDVALAVSALLDTWPVPAGKAEPINLGTGKAISMEELFQEIARFADRKISVKSVEARQRAVERPLLCADISKLREILPDFRAREPGAWLPELVRNPRLRVQAHRDYGPSK